MGRTAKTVVNFKNSTNSRLIYFDVFKRMDERALKVSCGSSSFPPHSMAEKTKERAFFEISEHWFGRCEFWIHSKKCRQEGSTLNSTQRILIYDSNARQIQRNSNLSIWGNLEVICIECNSDSLLLVLASSLLPPFFCCWSLSMHFIVSCEFYLPMHSAALAIITFESFACSFAFTFLKINLEIISINFKCKLSQKT